MSREEALRVLGLSSNASGEDVRPAYVDLIKVWHPDRFGEDERLRRKAEAQVKIINEAYQTLRSGFSSDRIPTDRTYERAQPDVTPAYQSTVKDSTRDATGNSRSQRNNSVAYRIGRSLSSTASVYIFILILLFLLWQFTFGKAPPDQATDAVPMAAPVAQAPTLPVDLAPARTLPTGTRVRRDFSTDGHGILSIENDTSDDAVVKVSNVTTKRLVRFVFVQQNAKVNLGGIEPGNYRVRFMFGQDWDEAEKQFTRGQVYYEFGKVLDFTETEDESAIHFAHLMITLNTMPEGNVRRVEISKEQFLEDQ